jgi:hypothetical protein
VVAYTNPVGQGCFHLLRRNPSGLVEIETKVAAREHSRLDPVLPSGIALVRALGLPLAGSTVIHVRSRACPAASRYAAASTLRRDGRGGTALREGRGGLFPCREFVRLAQ